MEAVSSFVNGNDVFVSKSAVYAMFVFDEIRSKLPIVVVINLAVLASKSLFYLVRGIWKYSNMYITSHLSDDGPGSQIQGMWPES